jgi:hypothetical protein
MDEVTRRVNSRVNSPVVMATVKFDYMTLYMPLSVAHQIQTLLVHAVKMDSTYAPAGQAYQLLKDYNAPAVEVYGVGDQKVLFDGRGIPDAVLREWSNVTDEGLKLTLGALAKDCLTPQQWLKIKGE